MDYGRHCLNTRELIIPDNLSCVAASLSRRMRFQIHMLWPRTGLCKVHQMCLKWWSEHQLNSPSAETSCSIGITGISRWVSGIKPSRKLFRSEKLLQGGGLARHDWRWFLQSDMCLLSHQHYVSLTMWTQSFTLLKHSWTDQSELNLCCWLVIHLGHDHVGWLLSGSLCRL